MFSLLKVLWEGRRTSLAAHVFPPSDVPSPRTRRGFRAREASAAKVARLKAAVVKPQGSVREELLRAAAEVKATRKRTDMPPPPN
jgi:hypothetical protein